MVQREALKYFGWVSKTKRFQGKWRPYVARPIWHSRCTWLAIGTLIKSGSVFEGAVRGTASWWQHGLYARAKSEVYLNMDLAVTVFLQSSVSRAFLGSSRGSPQSRLAYGKAEVFPSRRMRIMIKSIPSGGVGIFISIYSAWRWQKRNIEFLASMCEDFLSNTKLWNWQKRLFKQPMN